MDDYLFLGGESVKLSSELVKITVYYPGALVLGAFEQGMFREMCDPAVEVPFVAGSAFYCK